jgi:hypothetical protein
MKRSATPACQLKDQTLALQLGALRSAGYDALSLARGRRTGPCKSSAIFMALFARLDVLLMRAATS